MYRIIRQNFNNILFWKIYFKVISWARHTEKKNKPKKGIRNTGKTGNLKKL